MTEYIKLWIWCFFHTIQEYNKDEPYAKFEKTNGTSMVKNMAEDLEKMLGQKMKALKVSTIFLFVFESHQWCNG